MADLLDSFVGQPAAVAAARELLTRDVTEPLPPTLLLGPVGTGRSVLGRELIGAWSCATEPALDLSGYTLVMDDAAPADEQDRRYAVQKVRRQLAHKATGPRAVLLNLTGAAGDVQNALLKMLEEPPPLTRLVLISDRSTLLNTVRSRCHVIAFHPLASDALYELAGRHGWTVDEQMVSLCCGSAARLQWLHAHPEVAQALAAGDGPALAARLHQVGEDKDAGVTQTAARRAWCEMVLEPLVRRRPTPAGVEALLALRAGFKPEGCLALALLAG